MDLSIFGSIVQKIQYGVQDQVSKEHLLLESARTALQSIGVDCHPIEKYDGSEYPYHPQINDPFLQFIGMWKFNSYRIIADYRFKVAISNNRGYHCLDNLYLSGEISTKKDWWTFNIFVPIAKRKFPRTMFTSDETLRKEAVGKVVEAFKYGVKRMVNFYELGNIRENIPSWLEHREKWKDIVK